MIRDIPRPTFQGVFDPDLRHCAITLVMESEGFTYYDLRVKHIRDWPKGETFFMVFIPCEADIGHNLMVGFTWEAVMGCRMSEVIF